MSFRSWASALVGFLAAPAETLGCRTLERTKLSQEAGRIVRPGDGDRMFPCSPDLELVTLSKTHALDKLAWESYCQAVTPPRNAHLKPPSCHEKISW
jgi:hypothetical protein